MQGFQEQTFKLKNGFVDFGGVDEDDLGMLGDDTLTPFYNPRRQISAPPAPLSSAFVSDPKSPEHRTFSSESEKESEPEAEPRRNVPETLTQKGQLPTMEQMIYASLAMGKTSSPAPCLPERHSESMPRPQKLDGGSGYVPFNPAQADLPALLAANAMVSGLTGMANASSPWMDNVYTVMLRNLPNKVNQRMLIAELEDSGFGHAYDFLYLPIDVDTNANRGYAFINFINPGLSMMFRLHFEGRRFSQFTSGKVLSATPAALQGYDANYAHYSRARVNQREPGARPLFLRDPPKRRRESAIDIAKRNGQQAEHQERMPRPAVGHASRSSAANGASKNTSAVPRFCPECGAGIRVEFKFCQYCGSEVKSLFDMKM